MTFPNITRDWDVQLKTITATCDACGHSVESSGFDESSQNAVNRWIRDHRTAHRINQGLDDAGFGTKDPMTNGWLT